MPRLIWTAEALQDVQRCYRFLATQNAVAATKAVRTIREGMRVVSEQPEAGRPVERMDPAFREWLIGFGESGYVAFYRLEGDLAIVLAIRHQREAGYE